MRTALTLDHGRDVLARGGNGGGPPCQLRQRSIIGRCHRGPGTGGFRERRPGIRWSETVKAPPPCVSSRVQRHPPPGGAADPWPGTYSPRDRVHSTTDCVTPLDVPWDASRGVAWQRNAARRAIAVRRRPRPRRVRRTPGLGRKRAIRWAAKRTEWTAWWPGNRTWMRRRWCRRRWRGRRRQRYRPPWTLRRGRGGRRHWPQGRRRTGRRTRRQLRPMGRLVQCHLQSGRPHFVIPSPLR